MAFEECVIFWKKARIPTQAADKCISKIKLEHEKWKNIRKNATRTSKTQKENQEMYESSLNELFDIAHRDVLHK